ncbi:hypothetical protein C7H09_09045 [Marinobacter fuscus]|uniref:PLD phosphodiesterase domain-containing protein n=1 Tax=Marinobacter fuscus TaxID=2109942 RepID=A0A2T1KE32_9GAMM|nr:phospholipase D-like domain-containing protein [Marinobacter fuscus]PSF08298.1 hypothetical protein C7H09_09045 [Marinobacter fuscus]
MNIKFLRLVVLALLSGTLAGCALPAIDNQATVIGGRNIGDEYFGATNGVLFNDLDVMAIGPIVPRVSSDFDRYWNHQLSYPATSLLGKPSTAPEIVLDKLKAKQDTGAIKRNKSAGPLGSSGSSLHAKTFIVDGRKIFVGSFNFDPRSINLNTELGFVIESPELADTMERTMTERLPSDSYRLSLNRDGDLYWVEETPSGKIIHSSEPYTPAGRRFLVWLMSILPLEPLL